MARRQVLIAGSGAFGLSTASHLLQSGLYDVTIVERAPHGLAADAASSDLNKIVRSDYSDLIYAQLAKAAIQEWKKDEWDGTYHESGVVVLGDTSATGVYSDAAFETNKKLGSRVELLPDKKSLSACFPPAVQVGISGTPNTYINYDCGWAEASRAIELLAAKVRQLGGKIINASRVAGLSTDADGKVDGLCLESGAVMRADLTVIACGSWTPSLLPDYGVAQRVLATGQSIATVQLTDEEAEIYRNAPVILDFATGFYIFPPNTDNLVKLAIHHAGYVNPQPVKASPGIASVSTPITAIDGGVEGKAIPMEMIQQLRSSLKLVYPELGGKPFAWTRMCWYADTPDSDWLIDFHPDHPNLLFATGGSGHAFKFLPTLGYIARQRIEDTLSSELARKFAWDRAPGNRDMARLGQATKLLDLDQLAGKEHHEAV